MYGSRFPSRRQRRHSSGAKCRPVAGRQVVRQVRLNRLLDNVEAAEVRRGGAPRPEGPAAYALTCWADEILVLCLPGWSEMILEMDRYQQRLRRSGSGRRPNRRSARR